MEKIYLLCFTKSDFITQTMWTTENDGGGEVLLASRNLEFLQMRMREEVNKFIEKRCELLKRVEETEDLCKDSYSYDLDYEENIEAGYWDDGRGWEITGELNYGWNDNPIFYIQEIEIV